VAIYSRGRQATDDNIIRLVRIASWIYKANNTHSEYIILIAQCHVVHTWPILYSSVSCNIDGLTGRPAKQLPGGPNYKGRYDVTAMVGNVVLVNSGFHKRINFSGNYLQMWQVPSENLFQPSPKTKMFKEFQLEGAPNCGPSRGPELLTCPWSIQIAGQSGCMARPFVSSWCFQQVT